MASGVAVAEKLGNVLRKTGKRGNAAARTLAAARTFLIRVLG
jgi:hypothetical protein